jgi:Ca2+-binding RTX toxin-like protein
MNESKRFARVLAAAVAVALLLAAPAGASTVSVVQASYPDPTGEGCSKYALCDHQILAYSAGRGEDNTIAVMTGPGIAIVRDPSAGVTPASGCSAIDAHTASCSDTLGFGPLDMVNISSGDGNDSVVVDSSLVAHLTGGPGNDRLLGGSSSDTFRGGTGDDVLVGHHGDDRLLGGPGNDQLRAGPGNDTLSGGRGTDALRGDAGRDTLLSRDGVRDDVDGGGGRDQAEVDRRRDHIRRIELLFSK